MSTYLFDTNIVIGYLKASPYAIWIEKHYKIAEPPNLCLISIVTKGELLSLALQNKWGHTKISKLQEILKELPTFSLDYPEILNCYAEIDAYSYNRHPKRKMPAGESAKPMQKNDLWIAATASTLKAKLVTTDKDFDHLNGHFVDVLYIDPHIGL